MSECGQVGSFRLDAAPPRSPAPPLPVWRTSAPCTITTQRNATQLATAAQARSRRCSGCWASRTPAAPASPCWARPWSTAESRCVRARAGAGESGSGRVGWWGWEAPDLQSETPLSNHLHNPNTPVQTHAQPQHLQQSNRQQPDHHRRPHLRSCCGRLRPRWVVCGGPRRAARRRRSGTTCSTSSQHWCVCKAACAKGGVRRGVEGWSGFFLKVLMGLSQHVLSPPPSRMSVLR